MKAIINARLFDFNKYIENGYLVFDKEIVEVGEMSKFKDKGYELIDAKGELVMPSFVCGHAHIYSIFARGLILPFNPKNFQEILDQMWWKIDAKIDNKITFYSGIAAAYEFLLNGVTTVIDHHASGEEIIDSLTYLKRAVSDVAHMRGIYCFESSDRYPIHECVKENQYFAATYHDEHAAGLFGMHASMSLSDDSLRLIKANQGGVPIHCHVAESKMDEDDSFEKYKKSIIERFNEFGIIEPDSLIVHGVYLDDKELDIIKKRGAYMVVNTTSNMNNAVGVPNVKAFLEKGIKVFVGNDGLNSNMASEWMNVLFTSHLRNDSPKELNVGDVLGMIKNSYEYASKRLGIKLGKFEKGYKADLLRVKYTPFTKMDSSNAFGHILYGLFPSFKPSHVYVDGNLEVDNYKVVNKELLKEFEESHKYAEQLWKKVKEDK